MTVSWARVLGILSALSNGSCRGPAAGGKVRSQDASVDRPAPAAARTDWRERAVLSTLSDVEHRLSVKDTVRAMDGKLSESGIGKGNEGWWKVTLPSGNTAVIGADGQGQHVSEVEIYFEPSDGLRLRDLAPILGGYTKVFESKTAGVRFDHPPTQGVVVFADLFSSKILPDSEVVRVSIRHFVPEDHEGTASPSGSEFLK